MVQAGCRAGAQGILLETMSDIYEAKAALLAAKENSDLPVFVTMTFDGDGKLLTGGDIGVAAAVLEGLGADAIGLNCGLGPQQMAALVPKLREFTGLPLVVNPNAGLPVERDGTTYYDVGPEEFASGMGEIARPDQADALAPRPKVELLGHAIAAGRARISGVDVQIRDDHIENHSFRRFPAWRRALKGVYVCSMIPRFSRGCKEKTRLPGRNRGGNGKGACACMSNVR